MSGIKQTLKTLSSIWAIRVIKEEEIILTISEDGFIRKFSYSKYD